MASTTNTENPFTNSLPQGVAITLVIHETPR